MHEDHRKRVKERFLKDGIKNMPDHEVLELLLFFSIPRKDTNALAHELIEHFGSLNCVLEASADDLMQVNGIGETSATLITLAFQLTKKYLKNASDKKLKKYDGPESVKELLMSKYLGAREEMVYMLSLDFDDNILAINKISHGTFSAANIDKRFVLETAFRNKARSVVLVHNHVNGIPVPSRDDLNTTKAVGDFFQGVNVHLLDHLIYTDEDIFSMAQVKKFAPLCYIKDINMDKFILHSQYKPMGDQPQAIAELTDGVNRGFTEQTLLGVTGSGKTFTMANVIANLNRPTLILAHNKTLAAQLCSEFREFFPENAVEYFVSYYDYYQPEAYIPSTDTYIEKDSAINDEIDKLRHSATSALSERRDVIIVASVSCIYSLGDPIDYRSMVISLRPGMEKSRDEVINKLVEIQYERNDINFIRNKFRVRGDVLEIFPAQSSENAIRVEFFGDEVDRISEINALTGEVKGVLSHVAIYPASHYVVSQEKMERSIKEIYDEMTERVAQFESQGKLLEAQRIKQRTEYDIEMLRETGFCKGIENYSRVMSGREPGSPPFTLLDYFPKDFLLFVDESHVTLPQVRGMYGGDRSRKDTLVEFGFRLPSAYDNRPLTFDEFYERVGQKIFVSATPGEFERETSSQIAEQLIRPTGLVDPSISVRPTEGQIDDIISEINIRVERKERVLLTTLTKKMAEDLTDYLEDLGIKVRYMHHDVDTIERMEIIRDLRLGEFDVLVGINLLREGLDIPEVSLVIILDADKEGFLRSETSLIQTIGRAARNANGEVIMYADSVTPSMERAIVETERRRQKQMAYNEEHGIVPKTIIKGVRDVIEITSKKDKGEKPIKKMSRKEREEMIVRLTAEMKAAAKILEFEHAAYLRDKINKLREGK